MRDHTNGVLLVLLLAGVAFALSQTLVLPALPEIGRELDASPSATSWILTGFLLSASVSTPLIGKLGGGRDARAGGGADRAPRGGPRGSAGRRAGRRSEQLKQLAEAAGSAGCARKGLASRAVRALQIVDLTGPAEALSLVDLPDPGPTHMLSRRPAPW